MQNATWKNEPAASDPARRKPVTPAKRAKLPVLLITGDDVTDESVFAVMPALGGFGYSVGREAAGVAGTFGGPQDVRDWLAGLCDRGGTTPG